MKQTLTMKEMSDQEKPYEKCFLQGASSLSDAELISVIIRTGAAGEKSTDLAARVLNAGPDGLLNLIRLPINDLMQIRGIGRVKAIQLKCAGELSRRIAAASRHINPVFDGPEEIAAYYMERLRHEMRECLMLAMFDRKNMLLGDEVISVGTSNASLISPGEVYKTALLSRAEFIVLLHNHPSGNPEPSREDLQVTSRIRRCGELLDIPLMDHVIIGDNCFFSFRAEGVLAEDDRCFLQSQT
ncbi:MAG: DNA repair protein RadC [Lachnospiraceae bacterium]|nr:DNA repair protein RadC [Lachnospiraceae bacterium]